MALHFSSERKLCQKMLSIFTVTEIKVGESTMRKAILRIGIIAIYIAALMAMQAFTLITFIMMLTEYSQKPSDL